MTALLSRGYRFDAVNDVVDLGLLGADLTEATFEGWFRTEAQPDTGFRFLGGFVTSFGIFLNAGSLVAFDWGAGTPRIAGTWAPDTISPWRHVALVFRSGVVGGSQFYVDGAAFGAAFLLTRTPGGGTPGLLLGSSTSGGTNQQARQEVRDVRLWNRALTPAELGVFRPRLRGDEDGLVGWWPLDRDTLDRSKRTPVAPSLSFVSAFDKNQGLAVSVVSGSWAINANGELVNTSGSNTKYLVDTRTPDMRVEAVLAETLDRYGVYHRVDGVSGRGYRTFISDAGPYVQTARLVGNIIVGSSSAVPIATGSIHRLRVDHVGPLISVWLDDVFLYTISDIDELAGSYAGTGTPGSSSNGSRYVSLNATALGEPVAAPAAHGKALNGASRANSGGTGLAITDGAAGWARVSPIPAALQLRRDLTASMWVRKGPGSIQSTTLVREGTGADENFGVSLASTGQISVEQYDGAFRSLSPGGFVPIDGGWAHVAAVRAPDGLLWLLYIDGVFVASGQIAGVAVPIGQTPNVLSIGASNDSTIAIGNRALVRDVVLHNRALSPAEIRSTMIGVPPALGLVARWALDGDLDSDVAGLPALTPRGAGPVLAGRILR